MKHSLYRALVLLFLCLSSMSVTAAEKKGVVLVTGANRGLGLEFVKQFVKGNYTVYGTARKPEKATELKATGATVLQLDVTDPKSIAAMAEKLKGQPIDILINNAGYFGPKLMTEKMDNLETMTRHELEMCFAVNTMGPVFVTQALLPNLRLAKTKKIIHISTRAGIISKGAGGRGYGYKTSKVALNMVTRTMSKDSSLNGFIVVSVAPGHNKTDMGTERGNLLPSESVPKTKALIESFTLKDNGKFYFYTGAELPW